jgi:two-component system, NtrC family, sensor kinase
VASRLRIRHKLFIGAIMVVFVMMALAGGTLYGLWSYYLTTNCVRARLNELSAAEDFKAAVADLLNRDVKLIACLPAQLTDEMRPARERLAAFCKELESNRTNGNEYRPAFFENHKVPEIQADLDTFEKAIRDLMNQPFAGSAGNPALEKLHHERLSKPGEKLRLDALDLRDCIKKDLSDRIRDTRGIYQMALWISIPAGTIGFLLLLTMTLSFSRWVFKSIRELETGVRRLAEGDFSNKIELHSGDEMEDLAVAFNAMTTRLQDLYGDLERQVNERSRQLVRSERLASVGFLAAGVAHEINNPLASIAFCSEALEARLNELMRHFRASERAGEEREIFQKYLKMIQDESFRCKNITERLLAFSRVGERKRATTDLRELIQTVVELAATLPHYKGKQIRLEAGGQGVRETAWVNGEEIKSVALNLVINALDSMEEGGTLTIRLGRRGALASMQFSDTGCGMNREVLENIFEPFFTRSRSGKGTGLGLTISHLIVNQHGGEIEAFSAGPGRGSTFTVLLPVLPSETQGVGSDGAARLAA